MPKKNKTKQHLVLTITWYTWTFSEIAILVILGGKMILVQLAIDEEGQFVGTTKNIPVSQHHTMRDLWKGLVRDGIITQVRY